MNHRSEDVILSEPEARASEGSPRAAVSDRPEGSARTRSFAPRSDGALRMTQRPLLVRRLGRVSYAEALELQAQLVAERQAERIADTLLLLEHDPVFTLGRNARRENVLWPEDALRARGYGVYEVGRGGDVTYHGPGQVVGYPILNLSPDRRDVHRYVRDLEEVLIRTCADYGVAAGRIDGATGCWVQDAKIGAIGVRIARWVTSHGFAFNVNTDMAPFGMIVPCGIDDRGVTSLERVLGRSVPLEEVMSRLAAHLAAVFESAASDSR